MTVRYWKARLVKDGPYVGVRVWFGQPFVDGEELDRSPRLQALMHTEQTARAVHQTGDDDVPIEVDGVTLRSVERIKAGEYRYMVAHARWAEGHSPEHPQARPRKAVDYLKYLPF